MKSMVLDEKTGRIEIDGYPIDLESLKAFNESEFFSSESDLKKIGLYYYYSESVNWLGRDFYIEFRPKLPTVGRKIFMIEKNTSFYTALQNWSLRGNVELLLREENRLKFLLASKLTYSSVCEIDNPPYGISFEYFWGRAIIQSNRNDFNCGVYITWND